MVGGGGSFPLLFTSSSQGSILSSYPFSLLPTGGDPSARALVNMSILISSKQGSPATFGFVVGGTTQFREILIRAVGPSLRQFGVNNYVANPVYTLNATVPPAGWTYVIGGWPGSTTSKASWSATAASSATMTAESARTGAFPLLQGSTDKADIFLLSPGAYTITVNPTDSSGEGTELIEVYEVE